MNVGPLYLVHVGGGIFRFALNFSIVVKDFAGLCGWPSTQPYSFLSKGLKPAMPEKERTFQRDLKVIVNLYFF